MMLQSIRKFYLFITALGLAGFAWVIYAFSSLQHAGDGVTLCLIKRGTGIPCPSCGSTRSVMEILQGNLALATWINPMGWVLFLLMMILPFWLLTDAVTRKPALYHASFHIFDALKQPRVAIPLIVLIAANWMWNIFKHL